MQLLIDLFGGLLSHPYISVSRHLFKFFTVWRSAFTVWRLVFGVQIVLVLVVVLVLGLVPGSL